MNTNRQTDEHILKTSEAFGGIMQALEDFFYEWEDGGFSKIPNKDTESYNKFLTFKSLHNAYTRAINASFFIFSRNGGQDEKPQQTDITEVEPASKMYGDRNY